MRAFLVVLILVVGLVIAAMTMGFVKIWGTGGQSPEITATGNAVTAKAGQPPSFDVETGSVKVGTKETTVKVPTIEIDKAGHKQAAAATNSAQ